MGARRVALIGHSGAGKSACLLALGIDRKTADMDAGLGIKLCPSLTSALAWLAGDDRVPELVVVSNHEQMLLGMRQAKLAGQYADSFASVLLVYLHKPKDELREHLAKPTAGGRRREPADVQYTLNNYNRFHILFSQLADRKVVCSEKSVDGIAAEIQGIVLSLREGTAKPLERSR